MSSTSTTSSGDVCKDKGPKEPILLSPPDGGVVGNATVTLQWKHDHYWGDKCGGPEDPKRFDVKVGPDSKNNPVVLTVEAVPPPPIVVPLDICTQIASALAEFAPLPTENIYRHSLGDKVKWFDDTARDKEYFIYWDKKTLGDYPVRRNDKGSNISLSNYTQQPLITTEIKNCFDTISQDPPPSTYTADWTVADTTVPSYWEVTAKSGAGSAKSETWRFTFANTTVTARAHKVSRSDTSCSTVASSTTYPATTFSLAPAVSPPSQSQAEGSATPVFWTAGASTYTLFATPTDSDLVPANVCSTTTGGAPYTQGWSAPAQSTQTLQFEVGFTDPGPWAQTTGGDVLSGTDLRSLIPANASPQRFALDGIGGYPGVARYGTSADFAPGSDSGETLVSSTNWLVHDIPTVINWADYFKNRFGLGSVVTNDNNLFFTLDGITKPQQPQSRTGPYHLVGDVTTSGNWTIGDDESIIFVIDGSLTINGTITIDQTGTKKNGFIAFIVRDSLTVSPSVGTTASSVIPLIEGVYVVGGSFITGNSSVVGKEKLVGKGLFVASSFLLERDLGDVDNLTYPAVSFIFDPRILFVLPDSMGDVPVKWQEVAP